VRRTKRKNAGVIDQDVNTAVSQLDGLSRDRTSERPTVTRDWPLLLIENQTLGDQYSVTGTKQRTARPPNTSATRPRRCRLGCHIRALPLHRGPRTTHP
jgi:hypothetical protein